MPDFLSSDQLEFYNKNGYLVLPNVVDETTMTILKKQIELIIDNTPANKIGSVFATGFDQKKVKDEYFIASANNISIFVEDADHTKINKIGHALHWLDPVFREFTDQDIFQYICLDIGITNPIIPQSMYIFKHPASGGDVAPHQDSTFLYTEPLSCHGFWIPLVDVTTENGCLWVIPGSHKWNLVYRFKLDGHKTYFDPPINDELTKDLWKDELYIPLEAAAGSIVLLHGSVVHKSGQNKSNLSRDVYTFHIVDANAKWVEDNWLST